MPRKTTEQIVPRNPLGTLASSRTRLVWMIFSITFSKNIVDEKSAKFWVIPPKLFPTKNL